MSGISRAVFGDVRDAAAAAIHNEGLTRQRVDKLEKLLDEHGEYIVHLEEIAHRGFWGRLKWLLLGR